MESDKKDGIMDVTRAVAQQSQRLQERHQQRREQTDRKIMRAALKIIISEGVGALSIEEVSRASGVAKTTIYRRYRNTDDLLEQLSSHLAGPICSSEVEGLSQHLEPSRESFHQLLELFTSSFDSEMGLKAVGLVLSSSNQRLRGLADQVIEPVRERFEHFMNRGQDTGVFRKEIDLKFIFDTMLGSLLACQALHAADAGHWADHMTALLWPSIQAQ